MKYANKVTAKNEMDRFSSNILVLKVNDQSPCFSKKIKYNIKPKGLKKKEFFKIVMKN